MSDYDWRIDAFRAYEYALELARAGHPGISEWLSTPRVPDAIPQEQNKKTYPKT